MKKILKGISITFVALFTIIFIMALIDASNDKSESCIPQTIIQDYINEHNFNENAIDICKTYIPNYDEITALKPEGTHGCAVYCNDVLSYYLIFYSDTHPENPGEIMSIDTVEENRIRIYQEY